MLAEALYRVLPPDTHELVWKTIEWVGNVGAFAALTAVLTLAFGHPVRAIIAGALLSGTAELAQFWIPSRVPSISDVVLNLTGSVTGAVSVMAVRRLTAASRRNPRRLERSDPGIGR